MKKLKFTAIGAILCSHLFSQDNQQAFPKNGEEFTIYSFEIDSLDFNPGSGGAGMKWIANEPSNADVFTVEVIDASTGPYAADFPNADLQISNDFVGVSEFGNAQLHYHFYRDDGAILNYLGRIDLDTSSSIKYVTTFSNLETKSEDVIYYGQYWTDNWDASYFDPLAATTVYLADGNTSCQTDGSGELRIGGKILSDIYRIKRNREYIEQTAITTPDTHWVISYEWWSNALPFPIYSIEHRHTSKPGIQDKYIGYFLDSLHYPVPAYVSSQDLATDVELFPNPARDEVHIAFSLRSEANIRISVLDAMGRNVQVLHENREGQGEVRIVASLELSSGSYWVRTEIDGIPVTRPLYIN